jgi:hypothetical protein
VFPSPLSRTELLRQLEQRIIAQFKDAWLFPPRRAVSGFLGTLPVVIVGWRPAWGAFLDDGANKLYYDILTENGLENAHLTNIVKSRGHKGEPDPADYVLHEGMFRRELEIVSGLQYVVPLGDAYGRVAAVLSSQGVKPYYRLRQYASMRYGPDQVAAFRQEVAELAAMARRDLLIP